MPIITQLSTHHTVSAHWTAELRLSTKSSEEELRQHKSRLVLVVNSSTLSTAPGISATAVDSSDTWLHDDVAVECGIVIVSVQRRRSTSAREHQLPDAWLQCA